MQCPKCSFNGTPNLEETGPHTKATCKECGAYIKMVGRDELDAIINATINSSTVDDSSDELTLTIHTIAPEDYLPDILTRVKKSLESGFTSGEGSILKYSDEHPYHYDFYYK